MDRFNGDVEIQDPFEQTNELMRQSLVTVEHNCQALRNLVKEQRKFIADSISESQENPGKARALGVTLNFYDHIRSDLVALEEICQKYRVKIPADISSEILQRLQPPFHTSLAAVKKAYLNEQQFFDRVDTDRGSTTNGQFIRDWANASPSFFDHTQNIIYGPKKLMPSEFDDSDDKFKQDIMILRTKMFAIPRSRSEEPRYEHFTFSPRTLLFKNQDNITDDVRRVSIGAATKREFIETVKKTDSYFLPSVNAELAKIDYLKFVDGEFNTSDNWLKLLDMFGQQLRSKWYLVVCPQIKAVLKKYKIMIIHLSPTKTFDFIVKLPENGASCWLTRKTLIPLTHRTSEVRWLRDPRKQLRAINGKDVAATIMQSCWRGFWVRKCIYDTKCKYIAASIIWVAWIVVKKKRQMHERYLRNMLTTLDTTRQLSLKLSTEYESIINDKHVVIHLPSLGFPLDVRRTFGSSIDFANYQNTMGLKFSAIKNQFAHVIYVLPIDATEDLMEMYNDTIESVLPHEDAHNRVTFLGLSQAQTFADYSFNVSRTLHASEDTLVEIRKYLVNKRAFCLPWILDECDVRVAGNLGVPLLAPDVEMQSNLLNKSAISVMIDRLKLEQPPFINDIKDYKTLCNSLAEQICSNTEICMWLFKVNVGMSNLHTGVFLINHISVPFMPILRKQREKYGDQWNTNIKTKMNFLKGLSDHLSEIVSTVTRFSTCYGSWENFYSQMVKYGCLLQAVPNEKHSKYISVTLFLPGNATGHTPEWTGTAETIYSAGILFYKYLNNDELDRKVAKDFSLSRILLFFFLLNKITLPLFSLSRLIHKCDAVRKSRFSTVGYTMPQTFVDNSDIEVSVQLISESLQKDGYFGHLCINLYCFRRKQDDKIVCLVVGIDPCYDYVQHYVDWLKFAINGSYDPINNKFEADVGLLPDSRSQRSSISVPYGRAISSFTETTGRYAVVIPHLYHSELSSHNWKNLRALSKESGVNWKTSEIQDIKIVLQLMNFID
ncbi:uncharacterized protein [Venturia canescens]|uniref:uncharacterized protein n=1 Tax=Venturia canescens TaxID=32260 RepID=UPI001C9CE97E|nr:uncharacterized protein LOC122407945 [Venturia canescens]